MSVLKSDNCLFIRYFITKMLKAFYLVFNQQQFESEIYIFSSLSVIITH